MSADSTPRLFIAVATGNNVANLPPILEAGDGTRGDSVLWLESEEAGRGGWAKGTKAALLRRGFRSEDPLTVSDEPKLAAEALKSCLRERGLKDRKLFLVGNGGTKLTFGALNAAVESATGRPAPNLYGHDRLAELWRMPEGVTGPIERIRYGRARVTLEEILMCRGNEIMHKDKAIPLWPAGRDLGEDGDGYGVDADATRQAHDDCDRMRCAGALCDEMDGGPFKPVGYARALELAPHDVEQWVKGIGGMAGRDAASLAQFFNRAEKIAEQARAEARRRSGDGRARERIGPRFEMAVARRVKAWLDRNAENSPVTEAWARVKVCEAGKNRELAEFDVVLVLSNALLIVLECKSFDAKAKELDGTLLRLLELSTQLSKLAVCGPLYTSYSDRRWFRTVLVVAAATTSKVARSRMTFVAFTLDGQPETYRHQATGEEIAVRAFEDALEALVGPYRSYAG